MDNYRRIEDADRIIEERNLDLKRIVENRMLPGLLLLDREGRILFRNPLAHHILDEKEHRDWIIEQFDDVPPSPVKRQFKEPVENDPPAELVVNTVICSDHRCYGIRAFALTNESQDREPVIAVLVEEISTERLDLRRLNGSFHFSPREIEVIKALQLGMTDKMIAAELQISPETVHGYVKSVRAKLGVSTRTAILHKLFTH